MPAPTLITDLSTTAASNSPAGSETPSVLDDVQRAHAAFIAQLRDNKVSWGGTAGGTANAFTLTPSPASTSYVTGQAYQFIAVGSNTGAATVNVSGLGAKAVQYEGAALAGSEILSGKMYSIRYDGTQFQLERTSMLRDRKGSDITAAATTDLGTATGNAPDVTHSSGTLAITSLGGASLQAGTEIATRFVITGGTLTITHHATNLYLAGGANITLANGDVIRWRKMHSSNAEWKMVGGVKANGAAWAGNPIYGQCILDKVSTNLVLSPCNGNLLTINGVAYEIPDAGVSLSAAAVSDGFKYIYAYMDSGTMTLEASTTARATSTTAGNKGMQIKSGDDSRTLVGAAYCQSNAWYDRNDSRYVISWFNRRDITGRAWLTTNRIVAAVGPQEIHTEARVYFLCWADESVHAHANGTASNSNAFQTTDMCIGIDGVSVIGGISKQANTTATSVNSLAATTQAPAGQLTEAALHYLVLAGGASANTATYYGGADNALRCEINFRTRG